MNKKTLKALSFIIAAALALSFTACGDAGAGGGSNNGAGSGGPTGEITIGLGVSSVSRSLYEWPHEAVPNAIIFYEVRLTSGNGGVKELTGQTGDTITATVPAGPCNVYIEAFWPTRGELYATGSKDVIIIAGQKNRVEVPMSPPSDPTIPDTVNVTINPHPASVEQGASLQFTATVSGTDDQSVTWSVTGGSTATSISTTGGLLSVGANETPGITLTVKAVPNADSTKSATALVTVVESSGGGVTFTVTNATDWNTALNTIKGSPGGSLTAYKEYTIDVDADLISVPGPGSSASSFGTARYISVTLTGSGTVSLTSLEGGNLLRVDNNQTLIIDSPNLTLKGNTTNPAALIYVVGTGAELELRNGTISDNNSVGVRVDSGAFTMSGGTISGNRRSGVEVNYGGTFTMSGSSSVSGNDYPGGVGGGVFVTGGSTFTMNGNSSVTGNKADQGGGVFVESGTFFMNDNSSVSGNNEAANEGGGVYVASGGTFTMNGGNISGNTATFYGGGVCVAADTSSGGTFNMYDGTISDNAATGAGSLGGGVYLLNNANFAKTGGGYIYGIDHPTVPNYASGNVIYGHAVYWATGSGYYRDKTLSEIDDISTDLTHSNWND